MAAGRLKVYLGSAPGVGKTCAMLSEARRLIGEGSDVVLAVVETHGRAHTAAAAEGLERVALRPVTHRGTVLWEMDLEAVLARSPDVAVVDELAHSNAQGLSSQKRWQDVRVLLERGVDVLTTINIQHIESLNDVVREITGVPQRETVPDEILRSAEEVVLVDLAPSALRARLADGVVYPPDRIDAALSNYFRLGNLTALRELALLWLADEVESSLKEYREQHGIAGKWETRERVVVAVTGGLEGETLIRRGARIASRSAGGELVVVHVTGSSPRRLSDPEALSRQRSLAEKLGGTFHHVYGEDVAEALVDFARGCNATQLVIGASRRSPLQAAFTGPGIGATVVRESGQIDVHIVTHASAGGTQRSHRRRGAVGPRRRRTGFAVSLLVGPLLTLLLIAGRVPEAMTIDVLAYQMLVIVVALIGGIWPALLTALLSGVSLDFFFVEPIGTITVAEPLHAGALLLYVVSALLVSYVVDQAARRSRTARLASSEAEVLAGIAASVLRGRSALESLVTETREIFSMEHVRLEREGETLAESGDGGAATGGAVHTSFPIADRARLVLTGRLLEARERRLLGVILAQIDAALEYWQLSAAADEVAPLEMADRVRTALLSAVSHDLRRPLAAARASVSALRSRGVSYSAEDRADLLATADESMEQLTQLVTDLLDVSRIEAGALGVFVAPVDVEDVILPALDELEAGPGDIQLDLAEDLPEARADRVLLQRVIVNLAANALRFTPPGVPVRLASSAFRDSVQIRVADSGPGVTADQRERLFAPFQRMGDVDNTSGLGLGLALSKGFVEGMGGILEAEDTPGGGLTMVITLEAAGSSAPPESTKERM